jgi:D-tagatose-1,6-bisphosphate aldolase subunit GatZ/KbaZ
MTSAAHTLEVTRPENAAETITVTYQAFKRLGLQSAWQRTAALVVQPGVEFGDDVVYDYERQKASTLSTFIENDARLVFEAHSTDYQTRAKLRQMVEDHFVILKVGPALTFALREALLALEKIEVELNSSQPVALSALHATLEKSMLAQPQHWQKHYAGSPIEQTIARTYSFSDRIRYYWSVPEVKAAVQRLLTNLSSNPIPLSLLSAFLPVQYGRVRAGSIQPVASEIIIDKIGEVIDDYLYACLPSEAAD